MAAAPASNKAIRRDLTRKGASFIFEIIMVIRSRILPNEGKGIILSADPNTPQLSDPDPPWIRKAVFWDVDSDKTKQDFVKLRP